MGVFGSKCKAKQVSSSDFSVKYEKLEKNATDRYKKQTKERKRTTRTSPNSNTSEAVIPGVSHMEKCKHSKSLSLATQVSPKFTSTTDGDDVGSISTLSPMLENPLLKRANLDNQMFKRADGELRPVGPVHSWKLGKDKNQVRLELEETGLLKSTNYEKYPPSIDPTEEGIIGNLRSIGIIANNYTCYRKQMAEAKRKFPPRLTHLSGEVGTSQTSVPCEKSVLTHKVCVQTVTSKSEEGTESTVAVEQKVSKPTPEIYENNGELTSKSEEVTRQMNGNESVELKLKIVNTDIL